MTIQGPITFQDVAASFTEEQWLHLEDWQKDIYKTVVKEIHEAVISLGYTIINPNVVFSVEKQGEASVCGDNQSVKKNASIKEFPEILLKVKAEPPGEAAMEIQQTAAPPSTSGSTEISASLLNVTEENATQAQMHTSSQPKKSSAFPIKTEEEEEAYSIDAYNSAGDDKAPCPTKGEDRIKNESEEETDTDEESQVIADDLPGSTTKLSTNCCQQNRNGEDKRNTEDAVTVELGPKKRKIGSQVHGDILSLQEREARRLRVLEGSAQPFQAQTRIAFHPFIDEAVKRERTEVPDIRRDIRNTDWCRCGRCCVMASVEESICCHEVLGLLPQLNDERTCITKHPAFRELCLDKDRLDFLYRFLARIKRKNDVLYYLHKLRRTSYRAFVIWAHGFLDFRKCKPVPACVVKHVQELLPYPEELNVGYMKMYDYPAAVMALDHI